MNRVRRASRVVLLAIAVFAAGCKDEPKPNPDLQVPDVPESGSKTGKGDMTKNKSKTK